jgi:hypothetical protein
MSKDEVKEFIKKIKVVYDKSEDIRKVVNLEKLLSALNDLDNLIEMYEVKSVIISHIQALIVLSIKANKNSNTDIFDEHTLHTVFYGHPGVGKSKTAKILTRIWKALGVIKCCSSSKKKSFDLLEEIINVRSSYLTLYESYLKPEHKDNRSMWNKNEELWASLKESLSHITNMSIEKFTDNPDEIMKEIDTNLSLKKKKDKDCQVIIAGREDFVAEYTGQTAIKTLNFLNSCKGKCIIIEEAYLLHMSETDNFGMEALTVINRYMDEHPRDVVIIFTGYEDKLKETIFKAQPGLIRRCQLIFNLMGYTHEGLANIFLSQLRSNGWIVCEEDYVINFFKVNFNKFENFGGDTEKLCFSCKMVYSRDYMNSMLEVENFNGDRVITNEMIEEAYELYLKNTTHF